MTRWKNMREITECPRIENGGQSNKQLDYRIYSNLVLDQDPLRDWESITRCKELWQWGLRKARLNHTHALEMSVLDCGAKDGQFPEWLSPMVKESLGIEISDPYVQYCQEKNRPVIKGDVCNMPEEWTNKWDFVFSHHLLGLVPDYWKGLTEMFRATKKYMLTLNSCPGNPKKHYSLIEDESIFQKFYEAHDCEVIFNGRWNDNFPDEWALFVKKWE